MGRIDAPVLIVGGGPVGLAMALALARLKIRSIVLERQLAINPQARAAAILPASLDIFRRWGILAACLRLGSRQQQLRAWAIGANAPSFALDFAELSCAHKYLLMLPQSQTERLLQDEVLATGLVDIRRGHRVVRLQQDARRVQLQVRAAGAQAAYRLTGRYVVGCDGLRSSVRRLLRLSMGGATLSGGVVVADIRADRQHDRLAWPRFYYEQRRLHVALRLAPGLWRTLVTVPPGPAPQELQEASILGSAQALLSDCAPSFRILWRRHFKLHARLASHFRRGRVLLAGDAAHVSSPVGAQGMNSGLADCDNLAWKLHGALRRRGHAATLLASYDSERRAAVGGPQLRTTRVLARLLCLRWPLVCMRPLWRLLGWLLQRPSLRRRLLARLCLLDTRYPHSPLFVAHHALVGRRAADAMLRDRRGREAFFSSRHRGAALLLFEGPGQGPQAARLAAAALEVQGVSFWRILPASQTARTPAALCDSRKAFWRAWQAHPGMVALVRPDGYIGLVLSSVSLACCWIYSSTS